MPIEALGDNLEGVVRAVPVLDRMRADAPALAPRDWLRRKAASQALIAASANDLATRICESPMCIREENLLLDAVDVDRAALAEGPLAAVHGEALSLRSHYWPSLVFGD